MQKIRYLMLIILVYSCTSYPEAIEDVLRQAGKNRKELEKALKYYGKNPADSLKLRAAKFLIVNMPGKYSEYYDAPWNDAATVYLRWTSSSDKQMVLDTYRLGNPVRKDDVTHITAEYLINNIELAFKVWQEQPWGKDIPFDVFCEEILPYRVGFEPLENWRGKVLASFADIYNSLKLDTVITTVEACSKVNDLLPRFRMDKDFPHMSYSQLMASTRGTCDAMVALTVFTMRGLGIPVTHEFTPLYLNFLAGHSWNSVRDRNGSHISFMGTESNPGIPHQGTTYPGAKVYRNVYRHLKNVPFDNKAYLPPLLHSIHHIVDVTSEYLECVDLKVAVLNSHPNQKEHAYLAIYREKEWYPVGWGTISENYIHFQSVAKDIPYMPVYYHNGVQSPASYPFYIEKNGDYLLFRSALLQTELQSIDPDILMTQESSYANYTASVLKNTKSPFSVVEEKFDGIYTAAHWKANFAAAINGNVDSREDFGRNSCLCFWVWPNVSPAQSIINGKLYQTVELEAGVYRFVAGLMGAYSNQYRAYVVAALGNGLPDEMNIQQALSYAALPSSDEAIQANPRISIEFDLTAKTVVSLGFLATLTNEDHIFIDKVELWKRQSNIEGGANGFLVIK